MACGMFRTLNEKERDENNIFRNIRMRTKMFVGFGAVIAVLMLLSLYNCLLPTGKES